MVIKNSILKNQEGYTIVEVIIALAVLLAALMPLSRLTGKLFTNGNSRNLIMAHQLARDVMEKSISSSDLIDKTESIQLNDKTWYIKRKVLQLSTNLVQLKVAVYEKDKTTPVATLQTLRLVN